MEAIYILIYVYLFIIGACIASFMNVVIDRLPKGESFVKGRSHCDNCGKTIKPYDLIPIVSYLILKGKCRYCGSKIGLRSLILEVIGGMLFCFNFYHYGFNYMSIVGFIVSIILLMITMIDFDTMTIPDSLNIIVFILGLIIFYLNPDITLINRIIGMFCISVPMFILVLIIPDSFGGGDIKLMAAAGFMLGWTNTLVAAFIGIIIAGIYGIYLIVSKRASKGAHIAFGPYLSIGIYIALIYGDVILNSYLSLFSL